MTPESAENLPELTMRQEQILALIIRAYTEHPEPVSSKYLAENCDLNVSSATIRNEMAVLDELGYITAPHTSAGRVPTTQGFRYFVKRLSVQGELSKAEQEHIASKFKSVPMETEQWMRMAAKVLARTAHTASLVTPPISEINRFKHVELISLQGRLVLMVLVLQSGEVHQRMLNLAEPIPQEQLSEVAERINRLCMGLTANEVRLKGVQLPLLDREITDLSADIIEQANYHPVRIIYRDGLSGIIGSFTDNEGAEQALRVLEERAFLNTILNELFDPQNGDSNVRVLIGGEGRYEALSHLSLVLGSYGIPGRMSGAMGVLGPTHLNYGRAIHTVRYVSSLMTNMMAQLYGQPLDEFEEKETPDT